MKSNLKHFIPFLSVQDRTVKRIGLFSITIPVVFGALAVWFSYSKVSFSESRYNEVYLKLHNARTELQSLHGVLDTSKTNIAISSAQLTELQKSYEATVAQFNASHAEHERRIANLTASSARAEGNYKEIEVRNQDQSSQLISSKQSILNAQSQLQVLIDSLMQLQTKLAISRDSLASAQTDANLMHATLDAMAVQAARIKAQVRSRTVFGEHDNAGRPVFEFSLWLEVPKDLRSQLKDVSYTFAESGSASPRVQRVSERGKHFDFPFSYQDYGCVSEMSIVVRFTNNLTTTLQMNECIELANPMIEPLQSLAR